MHGLPVVMSKSNIAKKENLLSWVEWLPLTPAVMSDRTRDSAYTCGGLVTANERDSEVDVVHGCFQEEGDSIVF